MIDRDQIVSEDELHAYVDGELPADRRGAVGGLARDPSGRRGPRRRLAQAGRAYSPALRRASPSEVPPKRLQVERLTRSRRGMMAAAVAAVFVAFIAGGAAGWFAHGVQAAASSDLTRFTADALEAYRLYTVEVRHPVEVPGDQRPHLVDGYRSGSARRCARPSSIAWD